MTEAEKILIRLVDLSDEKKIEGKDPVMKDWEEAWNDAKVAVKELREKENG